jgi:predicted RNase H-like HicB family nuclease
MKNTFTAIYKKTGKWYSAWIEEIPGVNTQGKTLAEARENLQDAIMLVIESNRIANRPKKNECVRKEQIAVLV